MWKKVQSWKKNSLKVGGCSREQGNHLMLCTAEGSFSGVSEDVVNLFTYESGAQLRVFFDYKGYL